MRKLYVYVAMFAIGTMAACQKNNDVNPQGGNDGVIDDNSPVAVQLGVKGLNADVSVLSKAQGNGSVEEWNGQELYIYAFDRNQTNFTEAAFIDNVKATAPTQGESDPLMSGAVDLNNPAYPDEPFYYQGSTTYDFYGYHVDGAADNVNQETQAVQATETETSIYVPFTIDGTNDLMIAKANQTEDIDGTEVTNEALAYSAYAARRNVQPTLKFEHQLARFYFYIVPGAASADDISVTGIYMKSKTKGNLVVVGENRGIEVTDDTYSELALKQRNEQGALEDLAETQPEAFNTTQDATQTEKQIGESLLVIPNEETAFDLRVSMKQEGVDSGVADLEAKISAAALAGNNVNTTSFEAGKEYKVVITIYGLEEVKITAELIDWADGGSVVIDPDQIPVTDDEEQGGQDDQGQQGGGQGSGENEEPQP